MLELLTVFHTHVYLLSLSLDRYGARCVCFFSGSQNSAFALVWPISSQSQIPTPQAWQLVVLDWCGGLCVVEHPRSEIALLKESCSLTFLPRFTVSKFRLQITSPGSSHTYDEERKKEKRKKRKREKSDLRVEAGCRCTVEFSSVRTFSLESLKLKLGLVLITSLRPLLSSLLYISTTVHTLYIRRANRLLRRSVK